MGTYVVSYKGNQGTIDLFTRRVYVRPTRGPERVSVSPLWE